MNIIHTLYVATGVMVFTALVIIWTVITITNIKRYNITRDDYYTKRLNSIETLIRINLKEIINSLK